MIPRRRGVGARFEIDQIVRRRRRETPLTLQLTAAQCHLNGLPFLSPDNDTRTNLALLLADEQAFSLPKAPLPLPVLTGRWSR